MGERIKTYENLLSTFSQLRKYNIIQNKYITDWVDKILALENESEYEFIEISTAETTHEILKYLDKNSENADMEISCRSVLGIIYNLLENKELHFDKVYIIVQNISYEEKLTYEEQWLLYGFGKYSLYDLEGVYAGFRLMKEDFLQFLVIYKDFTLENYSDWQKINDQLKVDLHSKLEKIKSNFPY